MNIEPLHRRLSPEDYAALIDAARWRAVQLRRDAMRDLERGVAHALRSAWLSLRHRAPRSSTHLHSRT